MDIETWNYVRLATIAHMAAVLEAGDRGRSNVPTGDPRYDTPKDYASRARALFDAASEVEDE